MKYLLNLLIVALIGFFGYALVTGIQDPIKFRNEKDKRRDVVVAKLEQIRTMQEMYRQIKGQFAPSFDELSSTLKTDSIPEIKLLADPDDPTNPDKFIEEITYYSAIDSVNSSGIDLDGLRYVPYTDNSVEFSLSADTITYQKTLVPVVECMTRWNVFMGDYSNERFKKYDDSYEPNGPLGFGSMSSPNLEGNWN